MPKPTNKKPKARVITTRWSEQKGYHGYGLYIDELPTKRARSFARFFNLSEEERVEKFAKAIFFTENEGRRDLNGLWIQEEKGPYCDRLRRQARACIKAMETL